MKKLFLFAALAVFAFTNVNAQEVKFGAKAGVNFASISGDETDDYKMKTSFHFGGVAEIMLSEEFSVQPELIYSSQGAKIEYSETESGEGYSYTYSEDVKVKLDYLNLAIMAKYYVAEGFSVEAGPQIGFLLSAKSEYDYTETGDYFGETYTETDSGEDDIKDNVKSIDFGVGFGVGYKMDSGLNFAARYNLGLSNINDYEGSDDVKNQNAVIQLSVGFMF